MPRNPGTGVYTQPAPDVVSGTTIESKVYNDFVNDVELDLNTARPIVAGGTGGDDAAEARANLKTEVAMAQVTDYGTQVWESGSFYSLTSATAPPVAGHAFSGSAQVLDANNIVLQARDESDTIFPGLVYVREKKAGTWVNGGAWTIDASGVRYDAPQTLTNAQTLQARSNMAAAPIHAMAFNSISINGSFAVAQQYGLTGVPIAAGTQTIHVCDQWVTAKTGTSAFSMGIIASTISGFTTSMQMTVQTAQPTIGSDNIVLRQPIEGTRFRVLQWGTPSAVPCTVAFKAKFPQTGTVQVRIVNFNNTAVATASITVATANTEAFYAVVLPAQTTWPLPASSNQLLAWGYLDFILALAGQINCVASTSFVTEITGIVLLPGSDKPTVEALPLMQLPHDETLTRCQRYLYIWNTDAGASANIAAGIAATTTIGAFFIPVPMSMRTTPTVVLGTTPSLFTCGGQVVTSLSGAFAQAPYNIVQINVNVAGGLTANTPIFLGINGTGARLMMDARLT